MVLFLKQDCNLIPILYKPFYKRYSKKFWPNIVPDTKSHQPATELPSICWLIDDDIIN